MFLMFLFENVTSPEFGCKIPVINKSKVVLPTPEGPLITVNVLVSTLSFGIINLYFLIQC